MENSGEKIPAEGEAEAVHNEPDKPAQMPGRSKTGWLWPFFAFLFFAAYYYLDYKLSLNGILAETRDIANSTISESFQKFSIFGGVIAALISLLVYYVLIAVKKIVGLKKIKFINPMLWILAVLPWYFFARQLVFDEPRYTDLARAIISYVGRPLYSASIAAIWFGILWLVVSLVLKFKKK